MKKLSRILICLVLFVFGFGLVACGDPRTKEEKNFTYPSSGDQVYGNGGLAVRKGNYIYFVNGYNSVKNISNKEDSYTLGALMLMKLDQNGNVVTDENGLLRDDYYITMHEKLCGYEATNLFIHGNYLYFVSPCLENEVGDKVWAKERVVFNRIKLDKSSEVEEIYSTGVKYNNLEYQYYVEGGKLFILTYEKGDCYYEDFGNNALIRVDVDAKSSAVATTGVDQVLFAENGNEVFFKAGNLLKRYQVGSNSISDYHDFKKSFKILAVENNKVFISIAHNYGSSTDVKASIIDEVSSFDFDSSLVYAYEDSKETFVTVDGNVFLVSGNVISLVKSTNKTIDITDADATSITVVGYKYGSIFYYDDKSNLKRVSYSNALNGGDDAIYTLTTISTLDNNAEFDISSNDYDEDMLYFYNKSGSNYYLNRIQIDNNFGDIEGEMVGVYLADDVPEVEEETEEEVEE